jgi:hypothetical protein
VIFEKIPPVGWGTGGARGIQVGRVPPIPQGIKKPDTYAVHVVGGRRPRLPLDTRSRPGGLPATEPGCRNHVPRLRRGPQGFRPAMSGLKGA